MTDAQALALARTMRNREGNVTIAVAPYGLPEGYIEVTFAVGGFTCGISAEGEVSS